MLVGTGPGDVAVGTQQEGGGGEFLAEVDDMVDTVGPARCRELAGLIQEQAAAFVHELVEAAVFQGDVALAVAQEVVAGAEVVVDAEGGDALDQEAVDLFEIHQLGDQAAEGLGAGFEGGEFAHGAGGIEDAGRDRAAFGFVSVEEIGWGPAVYGRGQLPAQVEGVLDAEVEALAAVGRVDVRGVAGQEDTAGPVGVGQAGGVAEAGQPAG